MQQLFIGSNDQWEWVLWEPCHAGARGTQQTSSTHQAAGALLTSCSNPCTTAGWAGASEPEHSPVLDGVLPTGREGCFRSPALVKINKSNSRGQFVNYTDGRDVLLINWLRRLLTSTPRDCLLFFLFPHRWMTVQSKLNTLDLTFTAFARFLRNTVVFLF